MRKMHDEKILDLIREHHESIRSLWTGYHDKEGEQMWYFSDDKMPKPMGLRDFYNNNYTRLHTGKT